MIVDISQIKRNLLIGYPLFGTLISNITFVSSSEVETAATDGKYIFYNENYFKTLSKSEQTFLFAHEICHIAFKHMQRKSDRNLEAWNIATDAIINALLVNDGLSMPKGMIYIEDAINYNCEELYEMLLKDNMDKEMNPNNHNLWKKENIGNEKIDEIEEFKKNVSLRNKIIEELKKELINDSLGKGKESSSEFRKISEVNVSKPIIDWRKILKETIGYEVDWSYKDATIEEGVVCPHLVDIQTPLTEILLDVSGSVDDELLKSFLRECKNIMKTSKLKIGCFDTVFYGFIDIHDENEIDRLSFPGGGGTDFEVAINAFSRRADNKIIFTDGKGSMPYSNDIIWMIYNNQVDDIKGRKIIHVSELKSINKNKKGI
ncbi:MAG: hypothetical protein IKJ30_00700 [Bacilli bacterium]|nr:hypothetical protein [Bacilli bacterium]